MCVCVCVCVCVCGGGGGGGGGGGAWIAYLNYLDNPSQFFLLSFSEKNLQEFLYVHTVQVAPIH